jgi:H+/Cl- antiporter ClcA
LLHLSPKDVKMPGLHATPVLLSLLVGLLLGLAGWHMMRTRRPPREARFMESTDELIWGLLVLAAFVLGAFLTYVLLSVAV